MGEVPVGEGVSGHWRGSVGEGGRGVTSHISIFRDFHSYLVLRSRRLDVRL